MHHVTALLAATLVPTLLAACGRFEATPPTTLLPPDEGAFPVLRGPDDATRLLVILGTADSTDAPRAVDFPEGTRFAGYVFAARATAAMTARVEGDGAADARIGFYGPRTPQGLWGDPLAAGRTRVGPLVLPADGDYLILIARPPDRPRWRFTLHLNCAGEACGEPRCPPSACRRFCAAGLRLDPASGCPTCECVQACRSDADCPAAESCAGGACVARPDDCPGAFDPVCGADGVTYPNACLARRAAQPATPGACPDPACRADADCRAGERCLLREGRCAPAACDCADQYEPVCSVDGVTWRNRCQLACAGATPAHPGACTGAECTTDADCGGGQRCGRAGADGAAGLCYAAPECAVATCPSGCATERDPTTGCPTCRCGEACLDDAACGPGRHCLRPAACAELAGPRPCALPGRCVDNVVCGTTDRRACPDTQRCAHPDPTAVAGTCIPAHECRADADCPAGAACAWAQTCRDGRCLQAQGDRRCHPRCAADADCAERAGERCIGGVCLPGPCGGPATAATCPDGYGCVLRAGADAGRCVARAGVCARRCAGDRECLAPDGTPAARCITGQCLAAACEPGPVCGSDGWSYAAGCDVPWCLGVTAVASGECPHLPADLPAPSCAADSDCPAGAACHEATCETRLGAPCRDGAACGHAGLCRDGVCTLPPPAECRHDTDCGEGHVCNLCPADPTCPACAVCGPARCERPPDPTPVDPCHPTGCNAELCADVDVDTACVARPEQRCLALAHCGRGPDGTCRWEETDAFRACRAELAGACHTADDCAEGQMCDAGRCRALAAPTCVRTGCSAELCLEGPAASDCAWDDAFRCRHLATCERQPDGHCGFTETAESRACDAAR